MEVVKKRRDEIVRRLDRERWVEAEVLKLMAELEVNRQLSQQVTRAILVLELEQNGMSLSDPGRPAADDKLDRVLKELAELRAELRRRLKEARKE